MTRRTALASEASAQRGDSKVRAPDTRPRPGSSARAVVALAVCAAVLLILPWIIGNEFYVNMASQVLIYALFALSINMMLGYGGMVSLGHAGYLGIAGYACILATVAGYDQLTAAVFAVSLWFYTVRFFGLNPQRSLLPCFMAHATKNLGVLAIKYAQGFVGGWW